ncbi:DUF2808 domain-containing protein [filamentous cyanobacterium LEGE 11480]|uniref:DUF2808 domain-containing protein n=1 Tax=Romeriopsis navalis LEGE 11480 TaxID=2777977 RepID=A0A928VNK6_9CYAN|nr:DUF2808 domain-containing protein [Romeriopsis navalis]MBE9029169.1 DUF2808 domain-containing protein [Romeriopsis navalis LEGE 11480]
MAILLGVPTVSQAQSNPGFSFIWGGDGPSQKSPANYVLEYGTPGHLNDRYRLKVQPQSAPVESITITFPDYYDGKFRASNIRLIQPAKSRKGKTTVIPLKAVKLSQDRRQVQIIPETPIPAKIQFAADFSKVVNPSEARTYRIYASITSPGDILLNRKAAVWNLKISEQ